MGYITSAEILKREGGYRLSASGDYLLDARGRRVAWIHHGEFGYYACDLDTEGHAYPVGSLDNVPGHGSTTPEWAAVRWLRSHPPLEQLVSAPARTRSFEDLAAHGELDIDAVRRALGAD